jgi:hypothetical protein
MCHRYPSRTVLKLVATQLVEVVWTTKLGGRNDRALARKSRSYRDRRDNQPFMFGPKNRRSELSMFHGPMEKAMSHTLVRKLTATLCMSF